MWYFKAHTKIAHGTLFQEEGAYGVGIWTLILAHAKLNDPPGLIKFKSAETLAEMLKADIEILKKHLELGVSRRRIKIRESHGEFYLTILNWNKYQGEDAQKAAVHNRPNLNKAAVHDRPKIEKVDGPKIRLEQNRINPQEGGERKRPPPGS